MAVTTIRGGRQITDGTIPYADIQTVAANTILGNNTASATTIQEIALATSTLLGRGVTGNIAAITAGTGLAFSGTSIAVSANLASLSGLTYSSASFVKMTAAGTFALDTATYEPTITAGTTAQYWRGDKSWQTLNTAAVPESSNLYYTDARARAALSFTAGSGAYNSTTGVITIPTNTNQLTNGAGFIIGNQTITLTGNVTGSGTTSIATTIANGVVTNAMLVNSSFNIGTTSISLGRASASQSLTGVSIDGSAGSLASQGQYTNAAPGTTRGPAGLSLREAYNNGYPITYGNLLHLYGAGAGQLLIGWSGTDGATENNYIRSKRDNDTGAWSSWAKIWTDQNLTNLNQLTNGPAYITAAQTYYIGTTQNALNRSSAAQTLTGVSIDGSAARINPTTISNVNTGRTAGYLEYYDVNGATGEPGSTGWHSYISVRHVNDSNQYGFQFANPFGTDTLYWRGWDGSNPLAWRTLYHSGNLSTSFYIGTTSISLGRASAAQSLTGITSIDGYANNIRSGEITNLNSCWTDLGTSISNGLQIFRYQNTASNSPEVADNANWVMNIYSHPSGGTASYGHQISGVDSNNVYIRYVQNGSFGAWNKIWTAGTLTNLNQLTNGPGYITGSYIATTGDNYGAGNYEFASSNESSTSYSVAAVELRESNRGGSINYLPPRLAFHWGGVVASQISIESGGRIVIRDNPGTGYQDFAAAVITAYGNLYVSGGTSSNIYMTDSDNTTRIIHCNSDRIGFLNSSGGWAAWCDNTGNWLLNYDIYTSSIYSSWFRAQGDTGLYFQDKGYGVTSTGAQGFSYGNISTYGSGPNGYNGYGIINNTHKTLFMMNGNGDHGFFDESAGLWTVFWNKGNLSLGLGSSTTSSSYKVYVAGTLYATGDVIAYSDRRKKTDIVTIDNALEKVNSLRGVYYTKIGEEERGRQLGVIAQEVNDVVPEAVSYADDLDEYGVKYGNMVGMLIEAIKEQQTQIADLKKQIEFLAENR